uniref:CTLH domain-containing protein n=1 Tax=Parascaris univalens TaxID=6257 RepID=A0A914ZQZ5_PARUN
SRQPIPGSLFRDGKASRLHIRLQENMSADSDMMGASVSGLCDFLSSDSSTPSLPTRCVDLSEDVGAGWFQRYQNLSADQISATEMKNLVVDYLICEGYREAAELLCTDAAIPFPKDAVENLDARMAIRDAIIGGRIEDAIRKVNNLVPDLLDDNSLLHLQLLQQHLIELIRAKKVEESLKFAEEYLVEKCEEHPEMQEKLEKTFALLAFEKPENSPFASLMELSHRQMVATEVNSAVLKALHKPAAPRIEALFRVMVWAHQQLSRNDDAPEPPDALSKLFAGGFEAGHLIL